MDCIWVNSYIVSETEIASWKCRVEGRCPTVLSFCQPEKANQLQAIFIPMDS